MTTADEPGCNTPLNMRTRREYTLLFCRYKGLRKPTVTSVNIINTKY